MKQTLKKTLAVVLAACLAGAVSTPALARGGHGGGHRGGEHHGGGHHHGGHHHHHGHRWHGSYGFYMDLTPAFWYPWYYHPYYPYYGYGGSTVIVQQPVQYVSRDEGNAENYWYYCHNPRGYYPYISQCNAKWVKVRPFPADVPR